MEEITIEEFQRLDLRVGKIVDAKNVEGAKKTAPACSGYW